MADRIGYLDGIRGGAVLGWALDREDVSRKLRIELMLDGVGLGTAIADQQRADLVQAGIGPGEHGFACSIPALLPVSRRSVLHARFAGTDLPLERSGETVSQLLADGSIHFEEDHTPWDVLARHDPTWQWTRGGAPASPTTEAERRFLRGGAEMVRTRLATLSRLYGPFPARERALDFGSGTGRLTIPLARRFENVIAFDVSRRMLAYAAGYCAQQGVSNVVFCYAPESLAEHLQPGLDLVLALGVFEHIEPAEGRALLADILAAMNEGARGCIGFLSSSAAVLARELDLGADGIVTVRTHVYDMDAIGTMMSGAGVRDMHVTFEPGPDRVDWVLHFRKGSR